MQAKAYRADAKTAVGVVDVHHECWCKHRIGMIECVFWYNGCCFYAYWGKNAADKAIHRGLRLTSS
jgi:hypothetical protein